MALFLLKVFGDQVEHQPRDVQLAAGSQGLLAVLRKRGTTSSLLKVSVALLANNKSRPLRLNFSVPFASRCSVLLQIRRPLGRLTALRRG